MSVKDRPPVLPPSESGATNQVTQPSAPPAEGLTQGGTIVQLPPDEAAGAPGDAIDDEPVAVDGYEIDEQPLGRGGMGEVLLGHDMGIGRDVAIKRMRGAVSPEAESRFVREAKLQARLQHPSIVPVHQLGRDAAGRPYFTMKRLVGVTLQQQLGGPLRRLLRAFADVCLAVEFAHEHGVIHRDIKPANIMLGDFGEVYLLDWGVARVIGDGVDNPSVRDIQAVAGETRVGSVMGTPGYMAPEQAMGQPMTPALDVYALGCVLFEILTGEPLHPRGSAGAAHAIAQPTEAPSARRRDRAIPPELDEACVAALAVRPDERPSARVLAQRIQDYLDGDRDLERRRALADEQVAEARAALASGDPARRADAVHAAGRALALDPESTVAADLVTAMIVEPPDVLPPGLVASLADAERDAARLRARTAMIAFGAVLAFAAATPFITVRSWPLLIGLVGSMLAVMLISWLSYRRGAQIAWLSLITTFVVVLFSSRVASPFVLTPVVGCGIVLALTAMPALLVRPWVVRGWIAAAIGVPVVLEALGIFDRTWWLAPDGLRIRSAVLASGGTTFSAVTLVIAHIAFISAAAMFARVIIRDRLAAERRMHVQAWHLRQLLPDRSMPPQA